MKADKEQVRRLLKTARGQLDGILNMVEQDRYCIDISNQIMATQSILTKANAAILQAHMSCCVWEAAESGDADEKLEAAKTIKISAAPNCPLFGTVGGFSPSFAFTNRKELV